MGPVLQCHGQAAACTRGADGARHPLDRARSPVGTPANHAGDLCEHGGRRGFISPYGETNWARNLRAAGRGTIQFGRRREDIRAVELDLEGAVRFIREVIAPIAAESKLGDWFVRNIDRIDLDNPEAAAAGKPVFEIFALSDQGGRR